MKNTTFVLSSFVLAATFSFGAQAAEEMTNAVNDKAVTEGNPCQKIEMACKEGGYMHGEAKNGKGLLEHCMEPIMAGKVVEGVKVDAADITACQEQGKMLKK